MRVFVAGHLGMAGSAISRALQRRGIGELVTRTRQELDLCDQRAVRAFFEKERPQWVVLAAARVGGIHANNTYPAEFIHDNLMVQMNVIHEAWRTGAERLLFLGSSCVYPRLAPQPMREEALLTGPLEPTNEPYAIAKIAGIKACEAYNRQYGTDFRSVMPTNLYGPGDNYHPENSHVIPGMMRRFHEAKESGAGEVVIWGTGTPRREFLFVDDMAEASVHVLAMDREQYLRHTAPNRSHINVGSGEDISVRELSELMQRVVGFTGGIRFDTTRPDGMPRKLMDIGRMRALGWAPRVPLEKGLAIAYRDFLGTTRR